jgi:outer membrane biosynthesis protein TonB
MIRVWNVCLTASLMTHLVLFTGVPSFVKQNIKKPVKNKKEVEKKEITIHPQKIEKIKMSSNDALKSMTQPKPLPYVEKMLTKLFDGSASPTLNKSTFMDKTPKEILLTDALDEHMLKQNPAYMDYYRLIREKIRANTFQNYNIKKQGEVSASFLLLKDGSLQITELKTDAGYHGSLCKIAQKSIEKAAPFPTFPEELKEYSSLRFSVTIYFKNN